MALNAAKSDKKDEGEKAGHDSDKQEDYVRLNAVVRVDRL